MMAPLSILSKALALGVLCLQVVAADTFMVNSNRTFVFKTVSNTTLLPRSNDPPELIADYLFDGNECVRAFSGDAQEDPGSLRRRKVLQRGHR